MYDHHRSASCKTLLVFYWKIRILIKILNQRRRVFNDRNIFLILRGIFLNLFLQIESLVLFLH